MSQEQKTSEQERKDSHEDYRLMKKAQRINASLREEKRRLNRAYHAINEVKRTFAKQGIEYSFATSHLQYDLMNAETAFRQKVDELKKQNSWVYCY